MIPREPAVSDRTAALSESELRRSFEEAQRQADAVFAQYQLSQLVALGGALPLLAGSIIAELVRITDAQAGAIWLARPGRSELRLVATEPDLFLGPGGPTGWTIGGTVVEPGKEGDWPGRVIPGGFATGGIARSWFTRHGWHGVPLDERLDTGTAGDAPQNVGYLALRPADAGRLTAERIRFLALVRHELAIAFRAALLREELAGERVLLAAILDGATEGIIAVDESCRVVRVNRAASTLLGGRAVPADATCASLLRCRTGAGLRCGRRCRFEEVLRGPAGIAVAELQLGSADGAPIPVQATFSVMAEPDGDRSTGAVVVLRDLRTERAAAELQSSFLAAVSHELRTPLALITGHVDTLLDLGLDAAGQRRSIERIGAAADRLQTLVDELLTLTGLEHASLGLRRAPVTVADLLDQAIGGIGEWPGMPPVTASIPPGLPVVDVDAVRIAHVLVNLVDNARRYGDEGRVQIRARRRRTTVVVTVQDDGPGIPPDERAVVFDRHYRGRAARDAYPAGTGTGLHVCRRLVEAHGGTIWVEPGMPSAISFSLPAARRAGRAGDRE